jgi:hypothetical protein
MKSKRFAGFEVMEGIETKNRTLAGQASNKWGAINPPNAATNIIVIYIQAIKTTFDLTFCLH